MVNAQSKEICYCADGLSPQTVLGESLIDDPTTTWHLTMDLFMGVRDADRHSHKGLAHVTGLKNITDQFMLGSLLGIK